MRRALLAITLVTLVSATWAVAGDAKKDLDALQGGWKFISVKEADGKGPPDDILKEFAVVVKDDAMQITTKGKTLVAFKLKLDSSKTPKAIDFTHTEGPDKGKVEYGIYKIEGDTLTLCVNDLGKDRPAVFELKEGTKYQLMTLKKAK